MAGTTKHTLARARLAVTATSLTSLCFAPLDLMTLDGDRLAFFLSDRLLIALVFAAGLAGLSRAGSVRQLLSRAYLHQYAFFTLNALIFGHPVLDRHGGAMFPLIAIALWMCLPGSFRAMAMLCAYAPAVSILFWGVARTPAERPMDLAIIVFLTVVAYLVGAGIHIEVGRMRREQHLHMERERRANRALLEAKEAAEAEARAKSEFLATVSHEIRTPLTGVLVSLDLLHHTKPTPRQRPLLDTARQSGRILQAVIDDILDFSKIEAGKLTVENTPFDLRALVGEAVDLLAEPALAKGLRLDLALADDLPQRIVGDPARLRQVLMNLLSNAVKFTDRGQVALRVDFAGPALLRFRVEDTGIGIAPHQRQRLFEPFVQADGSTTRRYGGSGLGLAICRRLVALMDGEIGVDSEIGKGSCFWVTLPLTAADGMPDGGSAAASEGAPSFQAPPLAEALAAEAVVLLAEDNPVSQRVIGEALDLMGYAVEVAGNGRAALERLARPGIGLVIADAHMPEMDGCELAMGIRRGEAGTGRRLPIVGLSADAQPAARRRHLDAGMDDYVVKPFDLQAFGRLLDDLLPQARPLRRPRDEPTASLPPPELAILDHCVPEPPRVFAPSVLQASVGANEALVRRALESMLLTAPPLFDRLAAALSAEDTAEAFQAAHGLAGAARMVGAVELATRCRGIEEALYRDNMAEAAELGRDLDQVWGRLCRELTADGAAGPAHTAVATPT